MITCLVSSEEYFAIKVPASYLGIYACGSRVGNCIGIGCFATVGVNSEQVRLTHEISRLDYIPIYVNKLRMHFPNKGGDIGGLEGWGEGGG